MPDLRAEKNTQNIVTSLAVVVFSVPKLGTQPRISVHGPLRPPSLSIPWLGMILILHLVILAQVHRNGCFSDLSSAYQGLAQKIKVPFLRILCVCVFSAFLRVRGRRQNPRQTLVDTKLVGFRWVVGETREKGKGVGRVGGKGTGKSARVGQSYPLAIYPFNLA